MSADPKGFEAYFDDMWDLSSADVLAEEKPSWGWQIHGNGEDADTLGAGGGIVVAMILGTGVMNDHEDLDGQIDLGLSVDLTGRGLYSDPKWAHGTAMCGIVAALENGKGSKGLAHQATLVEVKGSLGQALAYCISHTADLDVICMMQANQEYNATTETLIQQLHEAGIVCIAPVGQYIAGAYADYKYPAAYDHVIGVGGTGLYFTKAHPDERYFRSAYGDHVDFVAPGAGIRAPHSETTTTWYPASMTTTAAAHAAAIFAVLKSRYPTFTPDELLEVARATAINNATYYNDKHPEDLRTYSDPWHGYGFLTVGGAVEWDQPEEAYYCQDITFPMTLTGGAELLFFQPQFDLTISGEMTLYQLVLDIVFELNLSMDMDKQILVRKILRFLNKIRTGTALDLVNSLNLDVGTTLRLVNHLTQGVATSLGLKLDLEALARIQKELRLLNRLKDTGVTFGEFYFDREHEES